MGFKLPLVQYMCSPHFVLSGSAHGHLYFVCYVHLAYCTYLVHPAMVAAVALQLRMPLVSEEYQVQLLLQPLAPATSRGVLQLRGPVKHDSSDKYHLKQLATEGRYESMRSSGQTLLISPGHHPCTYDGDLIAIVLLDSKKLQCLTCGIRRRTF